MFSTQAGPGAAQTHDPAQDTGRVRPPVDQVADENDCAPGGMGRAHRLARVVAADGAGEQGRVGVLEAVDVLDEAGEVAVRGDAAAALEPDFDERPAQDEEDRRRRQRAHRLGIIRDWKSRWFAKSPAEYRLNVIVDSVIRRFLKKRLRGMYIAGIDIERDVEARRKIKAALTYPSIVFAMSIGTISTTGRRPSTARW